MSDLSSSASTLAVVPTKQATLLQCMMVKTKKQKGNLQTQRVFIFTVSQPMYWN